MADCPYSVKWFALLLLLSASAGATTRNVSCSGNISSALQSAVTASANGDVVSVGAGSCTITSTISSSVGITLQGAGVGATNIALSSADFIQFTHNVNGGFEWVTGFTITGTNSFAAIMFDGNPSACPAGGLANCFRADHLALTNLSARGILAGYNNTGDLPCVKLYGVVDHLAWTSNTTAQATLFYGCNETWGSAVQIGTGNAYYIEDSTFTFNAGTYANGGTAFPVDVEHGAAIVFRHNTVTNSSVVWHDSGSTQDARSTRSWEVYNNTFNCTTSGGDVCYDGMTFRGGTGVVFDNSIPIDAAGHTGYQSAINTEIKRAGYSGGEPWNFAVAAETHRVCWFSPGNIRRYDSTTRGICYGGGGCLDSCTSDANCGGSPNKCLTRFDGAGSGGYLARDQVGASMDGSDSAATQTSDPAYVWNITDPNNRGAVNSTPVTVAGADATYIQLGRDIIVGSAKSGYSAYTYPHPLQGGGTLPAVKLGNVKLQGGVKLQ